MPPLKSAGRKEQDAERQKKILSAREKVLAIKRTLLSLVEKMIESNVSKDWFLSNCSKLCQSDYNDVVQERSIENLCGYPLCSNLIKQTFKQKYHISNFTNKVYDLTERKCFCSNQCYKASNYIKVQLSPIPLYMRKEEKIKVCLLSDCDNRGSAGEEVEFHHILPKEEVYKVFNEETSSNLQNILKEEVKKCADSLSGLQIKEHLYENQYMYGEEVSKKLNESVQKDKSEFDSGSEVSDDSEDENLFPSYDNMSTLSDKHMPIPERIKKSLVISPIKPEIKASSLTQGLSLSFVRGVFKDWMTEDTLKFLIGEKHVYGIKADHLFKTMTEFEPVTSEKLASIKNEYIELCLKIDSLPDDDDIISGSIKFHITSEPKSTFEEMKTENSTEKKVFKKRPKKIKEKGKRVTFASETKEEIQSEKKHEESITSSDHEKRVIIVPEIKEEMQSAKKDEKNIFLNSNKVEEVTNAPESKEGQQPDEEDGKNIILNNEKAEEVNFESKKESHSLKVNEETTSSDEIKEKVFPKNQPCEPEFPLVDSFSQNVLRRQVLTSKLKSVYTELLPVAGLYYTNIRDAVRKFVDSLSLTPTNITFKPKEWKLISLVLFRVLTRTVLKDIYDEAQFAKLCLNPQIPITIDLTEMENLVCEIISAENIIKHS